MRCLVAGLGRRLYGNDDGAAMGAVVIPGDIAVEVLAALLGHPHGWLLTGIASFAMRCGVEMAGSDPAMTGLAT